MTKRSTYLYQLAGKIISHKAKKKQNGTDFIGLKVAIQKPFGSVKKLNVFPDSCAEPVWQAIQAGDYLQKDYFFHCKNFMGSYYLVKWEELTPKEAKD